MLKLLVLIVMYCSLLHTKKVNNFFNYILSLANFTIFYCGIVAYMNSSQTVSSASFIWEK